jgi:murein DD-endopeptidase MepM/ murein hydrolase activator NlpD
MPALARAERWRHPVPGAVARAERWRHPVPGAVTRSFSYSPAAPFRRGAHRGADLAAAPGAAVRAACAGRVLFAGAVAGSPRVVTVRCGTRRVTYLPLTRVQVGRGSSVAAGARLGTLAPGHGGGLHLGVRRAGDRFAYEDPLRFLRRSPRAWPVGGRARHGRPPTPAPAPRLDSLPRAAPVLVPHATTPHATTSPRGAPHSATPPPPAPARRTPRAAPTAPAPWPVWAGLTAVLLGTAGSGTVALSRRRAARRAAPAPTAAA